MKIYPRFLERVALDINCSNEKASHLIALTPLSPNDKYLVEHFCWRDSDKRLDNDRFNPFFLFSTPPQHQFYLDENGLYSSAYQNIKAQEKTEYFLEFHSLSFSDKEALLQWDQEFFKKYDIHPTVHFSREN